MSHLLPRSLVLAGLIVLPCFAVAKEPIDLDAMIPKIVLRDGRILVHVNIVAYGTSTVIAKWDGGKGTILYDLLPDEIRMIAQSYKPAPVVHGPPPSKTDSVTDKVEVPVPSTAEPPDEQRIAKERGLLRGDLELVSVTSALGSFMVEVKNQTSSYKLLPWQDLVGHTTKGKVITPADIRAVGEDSSLVISPGQTRTFNIGFHLDPTPGSGVETVTWASN